MKLDKEKEEDKEIGKTKYIELPLLLPCRQVGRLPSLAKEHWGVLLGFSLHLPG